MKLLPCPFCGSSASPAWNESSTAKTWVECDNPDCDTVMRGPNAFERWNKRHNAPPMIDEVPNLIVWPINAAEARTTILGGFYETQSM